MRIHGNMIWVALLSAFVMVSVTACSGGGSSELVVTPQVGVDINPQPQMTVVERLAELGISGLDGLYEPYENGKYLKVVWLNPDAVIKNGGKVDYGAVEVYAKPWMFSENAFVEKEITSFDEVTFLATDGNPTAGGDRLLWFLYWHEISGPTDVTGTVRIEAVDFVTIWDKLNGTPLASIESSFDVSIEITDGLVSITEGDSNLWVGVIGLGLLAAGIPAPQPAWCPQISIEWQVDREDEVVPPTNKPPVAVATATPTSGPAPLMVEFDGSKSYDPDGSVVAWYWSGGVQEKKFTKTFTEPGVYHVYLNVEDNDGATNGVDGQVSVTITVEEPVNQPPVAKLKLVGSDTGTAPFEVTVDASESYDPDGTIEEYHYFFYNSGDGANASSSATFDHTYNDPGSYSIWLMVRDDDGATDLTDTGINIVVTDPGGGGDYALIVVGTGGTSGPIQNGDIVSVDETGAILVDIWELHGNDDSKVVIDRATISIDSILPQWVFDGFAAFGEIRTALWSQPDDPDPDDPGNMFVEPGSYDIEMSFTYAGATYSRNFILRVNDLPNFP